MKREQSFVEHIVSENDELYFKLKSSLDKLHKELNKEIEVIVQKTVEEFCIDEVTKVLSKPFELEIDLADKVLTGSIFNDIEFGFNVLLVIENKLFEREDLLEKISILLPQATRYYKFTINAND